jgi:glycosyltransferase involved in cell wall biosynthesis
MKRILFVATVDIHIINHHLRTIHELAARGDLVDVAASGAYTNADIHQKYDVCFSKNPFSPDNLKAGRRMKKLIREGQYDIVSCHTPLSSFFTRLAAKGTASKVLYTAHGFHFYQGCPAVNRIIYKNMERWAAHDTDVLVTINQEDYAAAKQFRLKPEGRVVLIPGVGLDVKAIQSYQNLRMPLREKLGFRQEDYVLFSAGELNRNKNHLFVIDALHEEFQKDPHLHYVICGSGPLEAKIRSRIREYGLDHQIHLLGYREDVRQLLQAADLFVFPSLREGLPVSIMEAMASGLPLLVSDVRGNRDLVRDGVNGRVYAPADAAGFQSAFRQIRSNPELAESFCANNRRDVWKYDCSAVDPQILSLYS